jgi:uncharacterized RDD family membrane protein YckC
MENNVISLVNHLEKNSTVETVNEFDIKPIDIANENITQRRIYSFLVDFSTIMVINTAIHTSYALFVSEFYSALNIKVKSQLIMGNFGIQAGVFLMAYMTYFFYSMFVLNGQTFGKMFFKLHTIDDNYIFEEDSNEYVLGARQAFRRSFGYLTCYLSFGSFFVFSLLSEDKRGIPDYFSNSRTVSHEWLQGMKAYKQYEHAEVRIDITSLEKVA